MTTPTVTYFFRHPRPDYHSIERVFGGLSDFLNKQANSLTVKSLHCPHSAVTPLNLLRNCLYARRHRGGINHITGDVHYLALVLPKQTTMLTIHDCVLLTRYPTWHPMHWFHYLVWYKWPISRAAIVTTISEKSKAELVRATGVAPEKIRVIPNFYDPLFIPSPVPVDLSAKPVILHIGTAPHKNLSRLIEAVTDLPCRLDLVGKLTEAERALLATRQVAYTNHVDCSQEAVVALYEQCDLVSFVSLYEGFGLPVVEGQVVGRPVITSSISPMTEVGGDGACYVNPTSVAAIRLGILRIWQDANYRNELIAAGRRNAANYTIERVSAQYTALYAAPAP